MGLKYYVKGLEYDESTDCGDFIEFKIGPFDTEEEACKVMEDCDNDLSATGNHFYINTYVDDEIDKKIHIFYVNKIKYLKERIFEYEDECYPFYAAAKNCENQIERWLDKAGIKEESLRKELIQNIKWTNDNCVETLKNLGWNVLFGKLEDIIDKKISY